MPLALAGGPEGSLTVLSVVCGALLPLFDTPAATRLRLICREFHAAVRAHQWEDRGTVIRGHWGAWRACFPRARLVNVRGTAITDADCAHLSGLREVLLSHCPALTDAAFPHLAGLQALDLGYCRQEAITDAAFVPLRGLRRLVLSGCSQATITDAALLPLAPSLVALQLDYCTQFSDALFAAPLPRLRHLSLRWCAQEDLTDAALARLRGLHSLDISHCRQATISDQGLGHLRGLRELRMVGCHQATITGAAFAQLRGLEVLDMRICRGSARSAVRSAGLGSLLDQQHHEHSQAQRARR
jgi:hypothetical protein